MTLAELKTELAARGFDYLSDTRRGLFINQARAELDDLFLWPYRLTIATGASPLTVSDLGVIESVLDTANSSVALSAVEWSGLAGLDTTTTGTPSRFYVDNGVVRTYPAGGTLSVRHFKIPPDISDSQQPLAPARFHDVIVDIAARNAYFDRDNPDAANALQAKIDRRVAQMVDSLLGGQQVQGPGATQLLTGQSVDW